MLAQWSVCSCGVELFPSCTSTSMEGFFNFHSFPCSAIPHSLGFSSQIQRGDKKRDFLSAYDVISLSFFCNVMDYRVYLCTVLNNVSERQTILREPCRKMWTQWFCTLSSYHIKQHSYYTHCEHPNTQLCTDVSVNSSFLFLVSLHVLFPG